jgi:hypothetical protein
MSRGYMFVMCACVRAQVEDADDFIELLNHQNYLLKKGARLYQCTSSRFSQQK